MTELEVDLRSYSDAAATHDHPYHQMILALEGRLDMEIEGLGGEVDATSGALVQAGDAHVFASPGRNRFLILNIPLTKMGAMERLGGRNRPYFPVPRAIEHLMAFVAARPDRLPRYAGQVAPLLLAALGDAMLSDGESMPARVVAAMAYMRRRYSRPIEVADVAQVSGVSAGRLHALFRDWAGTTPARYLSDLRLDRARDILAGTDRPIADIALDVGFSEQSAFARAFRRKFGEAPLGYRRRRMKQPPRAVIAGSARNTALSVKTGRIVAR